MTFHTDALSSYPPKWAIHVEFSDGSERSYLFWGSLGKGSMVRAIQHRDDVHKYYVWRITAEAE